MSTPSLKLYRHALSGHSHRAELALSLMRLPHERIDVDLMTGAHKAPAFLKMNPFGQLTVLDDEGEIVFDSNAIITYLAAKYDTAGRWLPREPDALAAVQGWLSVAAGTLAHGEQRQLEIGMALATRPKLLLLDEPVAGMGVDESQRMVELLRALRGRHTLVLVEHDMDAVVALADRISVLVYGRVIASGAPEAIRANPEVRRAYLGEDDQA